MSAGLEQWRALFRRRRHTCLLAAIVAAFAIRPLIGDAGIAPLAFSVALLVLLLVAVLTIQIDDKVGPRDQLLGQRRRRRIVGWLLAIPAIAERLLLLFYPNPRLLLIGSICWGLFFTYVTWSQLRSVLQQREVTGETITNAISVYLLLGLTWGIVYVVLYQVQTAAFHFDDQVPPRAEDVFPVLVYFSMTTLATVGFGDITPLSLQARYTAIAEGITGQFYLAILVARLVGMQMSQSPSHRERPKP